MLALFVSLVGGLFLYRANLIHEGIANWHLLHAGGSARGILLIALAATIHLPDLSPAYLAAAVWMMIFFVWTSILAMVLRALCGQHGFGWSGPAINKTIYLLYAAGAIAVFPACLVLIAGLWNAL